MSVEYAKRILERMKKRNSEMAFRDMDVIYSCFGAMGYEVSVRNTGYGSPSKPDAMYWKHIGTVGIEEKGKVAVYDVYVWPINSWTKTIEEIYLTEML